MALRAVPDHPKFAHLKALLCMPKGATLGQLEGIWHFTGRFTPQGNIGKYDDSAIEAWLEWPGEPGALIAALVKSGWLDHDEVHRLLVHDWNHHADRATRTALKRSKLDFCTPTIRPNRSKVAVLNNTRNTQFENGDTCVTLPVPEPVPEPVPVPETLSAAKTAAESDLAEETSDSNTNGNGNPPKKTLLGAELEVQLGRIAQNIHARHPAVRRCGISVVKEKLRAIVRRGPARGRLEVLHRIDQNHAAWCAHPEWQKDEGQYAKGLENWLAPSKDRWNDPPPRAAPTVNSAPKLMM